jgi:signal transduction histidine kinase/ActR/RegA family two-component response regulator
MMAEPASVEHEPGFRPSSLVWLLVTLALVAAFGYLRLVAFPDQFVPLTSALALLVCLWHRDLRLLWLMVVLFCATAFYKVLFVLPANAPTSGEEWLFAMMQVANVVVSGAVVHLVIRLTGKLESSIERLNLTNAELEASNEELAAREEEISQQNEELQSQTEELEQQTEELNSQTEELHGLNAQLAARERTLRELLDINAEGKDEAETLQKLAEMVERLLGSRAAGAAVLTQVDGGITVLPLFGLAEGATALPAGSSLAELVLTRGRAGALEDVALRGDIITPALSGGEAVGSLAAAPLKLTDTAMGALEVYSTEAGPWSDDDLRIVQWLADQCGRMLAIATLRSEREALLESERAARTEADSANHAKDEFVAMLSHELRTPVNAVLGWASVLRKSGVGDPEVAMKGLEVIERNARQQGQLISDLLDISRMMIGKLHLDFQMVDLPLIVEGAVESVRQMADAKRVRIEREVANVDRPVLGDPIRLQQVVWNLLTNAVKFTPAGGLVRIAVTQNHASVAITVSDSGEGIDSAMLSHLFERYRQADGSATRAHGGLGLGLAIVKNLVELHRGRVEAHSDGPGKGATFTVYLPLQTVQNRLMVVPSDAPPELASGVLDGLDILVVDDEPDARELISHILAERGAVVHQAASGGEALEMIEQLQPNLLISDIGMPGMDGYELIRTVRARVQHSLPAIALTAFARPEDRARARVAGFHTHVAKPVEPAALVSAVVDLLHSDGAAQSVALMDGEAAE